METMTSNKPLPFNPGRFADALAENLYAHGWGKPRKLKLERERRATLLRKGKTPKALNLSALLDGCAPHNRCRSGACPECTDCRRASNPDAQHARAHGQIARTTCPQWLLAM
jgi:hypothetical protein